MAVWRLSPVKKDIFEFAKKSSGKIQAKTPQQQQDVAQKGVDDQQQQQGAAYGEVVRFRGVVLVVRKML
jgi:hypothetical protein